MPSTHIKRKIFFLTYNNLGRFSEDRQVILDQLKEFFLTFSPTPEAISISVEEYNETDGLHAHVLLEYPTSTSIKRTDLYWENFVAWDQRVSHSQASLERVRKYCTKDEEYNWSNYEQPADFRKDTGWQEVLACSNRNEAATKLQSLYPKFWICNYSTIQAFLDGHYRGSVSDYIPDESLRTPRVPSTAAGVDINEWVEHEFSKVKIFFEGWIDWPEANQSEDIAEVRALTWGVFFYILTQPPQPPP